MGFLDKLLGRKPEGDEAQAAAAPAVEPTTDTAPGTTADTPVPTEQDDAHDHDHGESDHSH
jgi:hypothetical protein